MPLNIHVVDYKHVQQDLENGITVHYNTNFHTAAEAPGYPIPSNKPFSYDIWLPLILRSRGIAASDLQVIVLRRPQIELLAKAAAASIHTRVLNRSYAEDLQEEVYPAFQSLKFPPEGLFVRLGACSPKDGAPATPGVLAFHSVEDIVLRMTTSLRTWSALTNVLNSDAEETHAYFLPFDSRLQSSREYRVFCCPESLRITAVSQYEWHKPWIYAEENRDMMGDRAQRITGCIERVHEDIIEFMQAQEDGELQKVIRSQGFTFDVFYDGDANQCSLIELNTFGVRSACGSCLFHWLRDRELLYGEGGLTDIAFRVTMSREEGEDM
ncbi:uncharacterized protein TRIREDRAFT_123455 [Trichoderma reesei QM6a]|jgi:hypothetical protein|uniref:Predicted protein n=2 Tax=Hypocrea jecorina TaxID=51453 RepID=G0RSR5_HYPJQ|nr:uncharacterized protein TRIREDRAFT_123455 [Trichoderma reesei QM6a]EGR45725.1 predicted protein [Trichoderma reesei QM6a]ETR97324.1 hypothetical protein M419DRAFT_91820 [Trichoderma reesei RUT C-30]